MIIDAPLPGGRCRNQFFAEVSRNLPNERRDPQRQAGICRRRYRSTGEGVKSPPKVGQQEALQRQSPPTGGRKLEQQVLHLALRHQISTHEGDEPHQQEALQRNISTHNVGERASAPAQNLLPRGARGLINRRPSSAKSPLKGWRQGSSAASTPSTKLHLQMGRKQDKKDRARQDRARQERTGQDRTRRNGTIQDETRQNNTRQEKA